jgi:hypothetical protein
MSEALLSSPTMPPHSKTWDEKPWQPQCGGEPRMNQNFKGRKHSTNHITNLIQIFRCKRRTFIRINFHDGQSKELG